MSTSGRHVPAFRESQRLMGQGLRLAAIFAVAFAVCLGAYGVGAGALGRGEFLAAAALGVVAVVVFGSLRLDVELHEDDLTIVLVPLTRRTIPLAQIASVEDRERRFLRESAVGYEVKPGRRAYMMGNRRLVEITLKGGLRILVGTERPRELREAIAYRRRNLSC